MTKFLLTVNYDGGIVETPMTEWAPEEIKAGRTIRRALPRQPACFRHVM